MSCQSEPQHGEEVIVAVCGLLELYIYIIKYNIKYMYLFNIISNITAKSYVRLGRYYES